MWNAKAEYEVIEAAAVQRNCNTAKEEVRGSLPQRGIPGWGDKGSYNGGAGVVDTSRRRMCCEDEGVVCDGRRREGGGRVTLMARHHRGQAMGRSRTTGNKSGGGKTERKEVCRGKPSDVACGSEARRDPWTLKSTPLALARHTQPNVQSTQDLQHPAALCSSFSSTLST